MDELTFRNLLDVHGADRSRWPAAIRAEMEAVLAASPAARQDLAEAERLDALLAKAPEAEVSEALIRKILAASPKAAEPKVVPFGRPHGAVPARRMQFGRAILARAAAFVAVAGLCGAILGGNLADRTEALEELAWLDEALGDDLVDTLYEEIW